MERDRMAALTQQDERLQFPIICNMSKEIWKTKEAKTKAEEAPVLGDAKKRGILMEAVTAIMLLLAGADVLIMRHPEAIKLVREMISDFMAK
jgi:acetyl-CoA decarbonylase/synthase complex subunit delta